jgi:hypothetical protein
VWWLYLAPSVCVWPPGTGPVRSFSAHCRAALVVCDCDPGTGPTADSLSLHCEALISEGGDGRPLMHALWGCSQGLNQQRTRYLLIIQLHGLYQCIVRHWSVRGEVVGMIPYACTLRLVIPALEQQQAHFHNLFFFLLLKNFSQPENC